VFRKEKRQLKPAKADFVLHLNWTNPHPFNKHVRRYCFRYAGIEFHWKGTSTVKESRGFGFFLHFNHLKLVALVPVASGETPETPAGPTRSWSSLSRLSRKSTNKPKMRQIVLATYTSSIAPRKSGALEMLDAEIIKFICDFVPKETENLPISQLNRLGPIAEDQHHGATTILKEVPSLDDPVFTPDEKNMNHLGNAISADQKKIGF